MYICVCVYVEEGEKRKEGLCVCVCGRGGEKEGRSACVVQCHVFIQDGGERSIMMAPAATSLITAEAVRVNFGTFSILQSLPPLNTILCHTDRASNPAACLDGNHGNIPGPALWGARTAESGQVGVSLTPPVSTIVV